MGHKKVTALRWLMVSCPPYWIKDGGHFKKGLRSAKKNAQNMVMLYQSMSNFMLIKILVEKRGQKWWKILNICYKNL